MLEKTVENSDKEDVKKKKNLNIICFYFFILKNTLLSIFACMKVLYNEVAAVCMKILYSNEECFSHHVNNLYELKIYMIKRDKDKEFNY